MDVYALEIERLPEDEVFGQLLTVADEDKADRILKYLRKEDAVRTLYADLLVRYLLCRKGYRPEEISFRYNAFGKPALSIPGVHFNVAHSGKWIVAALSDTETGIDVEQIVPIEMDIAANYFSREECRQLFSLAGEQQLSLFFELWTCKESYLKFCGTGLSAPLDSFTVVPSGNGTAGVTDVHGKNMNVFLKQYPLDAAYRMAVCSAENNFSAPERISIDELTSFFLRNDRI